MEAVTLRRGGRDVVRGLSFTVDAGGLLWLAGPNGAGKSTVLRALAGLLPIDAGRMTLAGRRALADERPALDDDMTLLRALEWWRRLDRSPLPVADALRQLGLDALADVPVRYLSTGQRRRAALARVALSSASLWLLDEPANALDDASTEALALMIDGHLGAGGGVVIASHVPIGDLRGRARRIDLGALP